MLFENNRYFVNLSTKVGLGGFNLSTEQGRQVLETYLHLSGIFSHSPVGLGPALFQCLDDSA